MLEVGYYGLLDEYLNLLIGRMAALAPRMRRPSTQWDHSFLSSLAFLYRPSSGRLVTTIRYGISRDRARWSSRSEALLDNVLRPAKQRSGCAKT